MIASVAAAAGVVAASYPKTLGDVSWNTFNPTVGGRRSYASALTTDASPNFTDTPGWTWLAGGPLGAPPGYQLQVKVHTDRLEGVGSFNANHFYGLHIGATGPIISNQSGAVSDITSAYTNVANTVAGAVTFRDWLDSGNTGGGGTAFVGNATLSYRYTRA